MSNSFWSSNIPNFICETTNFYFLRTTCTSDSVVSTVKCAPQRPILDFSFPGACTS